MMKQSIIEALLMEMSRKSSCSKRAADVSRGIRFTSLCV